MHKELKPLHILVFRLSSLGDVVLAASVLSTPAARAARLDWVSLPENMALLQGHPAVSRLIPFERATGLSGWVRLCRKLWLESHDEVWDLHSSLRTGVARLLFALWDLSRGRLPRAWRRVSKQRLRKSGYYVFKRLWPRRFRPSPFFQLCADLPGQRIDDERTPGPDLRHLVDPKQKELWRQEIGERYYCVMPSSRWPGKQWPVEFFVEWIKAQSMRSTAVPVILGSSSDRSSVELAARLSRENLKHVSAIGRTPLGALAGLLAGAEAYFGVDTGAAHLAESLGVPAHVIFGPTAPDAGFGPRLPASRAYGADLWCRPCGKDGRACFRIWDRYACLRLLAPAQVNWTPIRAERL